MQLAITAQGNYRFPVPPGAGFTVSITGAFNGATATVQFLNDVAGTVTAQPFSTTGLSLTAAGEKQGINMGSRSEINIAVTVANPTGIVVNVNPLITLTRSLR